MRGFDKCVVMAVSLAVFGASGCGDDKGGDESTSVTATMNATDGNTMSGPSTSEPTSAGSTTTGPGDEDGTSDPTTGASTTVTTVSSDPSTTGPTTMTTDDTTDTGVDPDFVEKCKASFLDSYAGFEKYCPCAVEAGESPDVETCLGGADPVTYGECACPIYAKYPGEQATQLCSGAAAADFAACTDVAADCMAVGQCLSDFLMAVFECPESSQEASDEVDLACGE